MTFVVPDSYGGGSADWAKAVAGIKYAFLIELRDSGKHGFLLPPDQITPTGEETWAGLRTIGKELISLYNITRPSSGSTHAKSTEAKPKSPRTRVGKNGMQVPSSVPRTAVYKEVPGSVPGTSLHTEEAEVQATGDKEVAGSVEAGRRSSHSVSTTYTTASTDCHTVSLCTYLICTALSFTYLLQGLL